MDKRNWTNEFVFKTTCLKHHELVVHKHPIGLVYRVWSRMEEKYNFIYEITSSDTRINWKHTRLLNSNLNSVENKVNAAKILDI